MAKRSTQGRKSQRTVGFAVVGLGHIAQAAVLPAFANSRTSRLVALVSGDEAKRRQLQRAYPGTRAYGYQDFDECLASEDVDAVYIAEPNTLHAEFAVRAARAGVHVLCEKPMAPTEEECQAIVGACRDTGVKLMIAYRLHFEEANLKAVDLVRKGRLGEPRLFSSVFCYQARSGNIRLKLETGGGPVWDIGIYCVNAARYLFADEPIEVAAFSAAGEPSRFAEVEEGMGVLMRFPGEKLASFTVSYGAAPEGFYEVVGTRGRLRLDNAYDYEGERVLSWQTRGPEQSKAIPESDQFGSELAYFSQCILADREPEPSGWRAWPTCGSSPPSTSRRPRAARSGWSRSASRSGRGWSSSSAGRRSRGARPCTPRRRRSRASGYSPPQAASATDSMAMAARAAQ